LFKGDSSKEIESAQAINPIGRANFIIDESMYNINHKIYKIHLIEYVLQATLIQLFSAIEIL